MLNRIFMFVYALLNLMLGVIVLLVVTKYVSLGIIAEKMEPLLGSMPLTAGAVAFIIFSLISMMVALYSGGPKKIRVAGGENGEVYMTVGAIGKLVERIVSKIDGLTNTGVEVKGSSKLRIIINAVATPDCKVAEVTALVQEQVKSGLAESLGREIDRVDLRIKDVKQPL